MTPDDPRHGTTRGFHAGCRLACCKAARARYEKESRHIRRTQGGRAVPAVGAQRRIRALMRLGWTSADIAAAAGWNNRNDVLRIINGQRGKPTRYLERATANTITDVYNRLSMRTPPRSPARARTRALAERRGYPSPLAWDDETIDDPAARPEGLNFSKAAAVIDDAAIERVIAGDRTVRLHKGETEEVVRRLLAAGVSTHAIRDDYGIKAERYIKLSDRQRIAA